MNKFLITGGIPLRGEVSLCGAKNSGFKLMIAALYSDKPSTIRNFSKIGDVYSTAEIIQDLGGEVIFKDNHVLQVSSKNLQTQSVSESSGKLSRAATYFIGPLINRFKRVVIPVPGGCKIGKRPVDRHLDGLKALGAEVNIINGHYEITAQRLRGAEFTFPKNTHGGTDIMVIAAVGAVGKTVLHNAAQEPEVDDLIAFLNQMGARIQRIKPRTIVIEGVDSFNPAEYTVMSDRNEAVTFACAALATRGDIFVKKADPRMLNAFLEALDMVGGGYEIKDDGIRFFYKGQLKAVNIATKPYPGFMTDWMALWSILMTQASGTSMVHETIFENRFAFVEELKKMGAKVEMFNPEVENPEGFYNFNIKDDSPDNFHAIKIYGPTKLLATKENIADLRAGASLILASLIAEGESELTGIEHVDRGYEDLDRRLCSLGAKIEKVNA